MKGKIGERKLEKISRFFFGETDKSVNFDVPNKK